MAETRCPKCGGTAAGQLAPGYFECLSDVLVGVVPPGVQGNVSPTPVPVHGVCGHRYQTGGISAETCRCGMFAVGRCKICSNPICGEHGERGAGGAFVCIRHRQEAEAQAREVRIADERGQRAEQAARRAEWDAAYKAAYEKAREPLIQRFRSIADPVERLVTTLGCVLQAHKADSSFGTSDDWMYWSVSDPVVLSRVVPEYWPEPPKSLPETPGLPWDSAAIAKWWASHANARRIQPRAEFAARLGGLGGQRRGWQFTGIGSKERFHVVKTEGRSIPPRKTYRITLYVDRSGTRWSHMEIGRLVRNAGEFAPLSLAEMARTLGLNKDASHRLPVVTLDD